MSDSPRADDHVNDSAMQPECDEDSCIASKRSGSASEHNDQDGKNTSLDSDSDWNHVGKEDVNGAVDEGTPSLDKASTAAPASAEGHPPLERRLDQMNLPLSETKAVLAQDGEQREKSTNDSLAEIKALLASATLTHSPLSARAETCTLAPSVGACEECATRKEKLQRAESLVEEATSQMWERRQSSALADARERHTDRCAASGYLFYSELLKMGLTADQIWAEQWSHKRRMYARRVAAPTSDSSQDKEEVPKVQYINLPRFGGDPFELQKWIQTMNTILPPCSSNFAQAAILGNLAETLDGNALRWWERELPTWRKAALARDWSALKFAMEEAFAPPSGTKKDAIIRAFSPATETLEAYWKDKLKLLQTAFPYMGDDFFAKRIVDGLTPDLKKLLGDEYFDSKPLRAKYKPHSRAYGCDPVPILWDLRQDIDRAMKPAE